MSELVITEVYHYSPTILEHHLPTPGLTTNSTTSTRGTAADEESVPYTELTSPITAQKSTTWDQSLLL